MKYALFPLAIFALFFNSSCKKDESPQSAINSTVVQNSDQEGWTGINPESLKRTLFCEWRDEGPTYVRHCYCATPASDCLPTVVIWGHKPPNWIDFEDAVGNGTTHAFFGTAEAQSMFSDLTNSQLNSLQDSTIGFMKTPVGITSGEYYYVAAAKSAIAYNDSVYDCESLISDPVEYNSCVFEKVEALRTAGEIVVVIPARDEE